MACPSFIPRERLESWADPPRVPLVEPCDGVCSRSGSHPDDETLRTCCNAGYARGRCALVGAGDPDAVRLTVAERGAPPRVRYIIEKEHLPVESGWAEDALPGSPVEAQARVFLAAWLRRAGFHSTVQPYA